jgi:hypothetical protein
MNMNEAALIVSQRRLGRRPLGGKVKLVGMNSNRSAIGARVTLHYGSRRQAQEVMSQASFYSASDLRLHFGLGTGGAA